MRELNIPCFEPIKELIKAFVIPSGFIIVYCLN